MLICTWQSFETYLLIDKKLSASKKNVSALKSRYNLLQKHFEGKELNRDNFNLYIAELRAKGYKNTYINGFIKLAKHLDKFLKINQLQDYTYFREKQERKEILTPEEVEKLINTSYPYQRLAEEKNHRDFVAITFLYSTACRIGELTDLKWKDIFDMPVPYVVFRDTKNGEDREVPITERILELLRTMPNHGDRVFNSKNGMAFERTQFTEHLKKKAALAGITKNVHPHIFRHSRATHLGTIMNAPTPSITLFLGHKDPKTTMRYSHPTLEQLSSLAYSSTLESKTAPIQVVGKLIKDFTTKIIDEKKFNVFMQSESEGKLTITIEMIYE